MPTSFPALRFSQRQARTLALCTVLISIGSAVAESEVLIREPGRQLDVVDLVINWSSLRHKVVSVSGRVRCLNENYCWLQGLPELTRVASLDIGGLPWSDKRHLVLDCQAQPCEILFNGQVQDDDVTVLLIDKSARTDVPAATR